MLAPNDPRQLWRRYVLALCVVLALLGASHWASLRSLSGGEEAAAVINLSGRQRMLSQRILYFSSQAVARGDGAPDPRLAEAVNLFERSHRALAEGGDLGLSREGGALRAPVYQAAPDGRSLDAMVDAFVADARTVLADRGAERERAWDRMRRTGPTTLLRRLDAAVKAFEHDAREATRAARRIAHATFALALLVLLAEALLIFWPAQRVVNASLRRLMGANGALEDARRRTERHLAEARGARAEAERALEVRARFLANISHELRTPLNGIMGMLELLRDAPAAAPESRDRACTAHAAAERLMGTLRDVVDLARIGSGKVRVEARPFDPAALAEEAAEAVSDRAAAGGLALQVVRGALPRRVTADPERLRQVLGHLLDNAVKFTPEGEVSLRVEHRLEEGGRLRIEVRDTGVGIGPELRGRLFGSFEQADGSTTRRHGGAGLGLALCRGLVEAMGGRITVESEEGRGALFRLEIPALATAGEGTTTPDAGGEAVAPAAREEPARPAAPLRVLVAEDNAVNRKVAEAFLGRLGHRATCVPDGAAAVEAVARGGHDLVLMDVQMPVMDGLQATRAIRAAGSPIPIVALTANAMEGQRESYEAAGMDGCLGKPIRAAELAEAIADALWAARARTGSGGGALKRASA